MRYILLKRWGKWNFRENQLLIHDLGVEASTSSNMKFLWCCFSAIKTDFFNKCQFINCVKITWRILSHLISTRNKTGSYRSTLTDIENRLVVAKGERAGGGWRDWEFGVSKCRLLYVYMCSVDQPCLILCDPINCSPPGSSVYGIFQARILRWVAISFSNTPEYDSAIKINEWSSQEQIMRKF